MAYSVDIATAPEITIGGTDGDWDNLTATDNAGEPLNVAGSSGNNVWQKVHLVDAGSYTFTHDTTPPDDTVMTIYRGPASATYADLVSVGSGDDEAGNYKPKITYTSAGGEWIYIESSGYAGDRVSGQTTLIAVVVIGAGWTNCQGGGSWFRGWAADMGEYTGPWPMMPPPNVAGGNPSTSDEIDFVLGYPNPSDPSDPNIALDGSYDSPIWNCWRVLNSSPPPDSETDYRLDAVGSATTPGPTDVPPAGIHLYVVSYFGPGGALINPPNSAASYVPANYTASGTCPNQTLPGGWSTDWQDNVPQTRLIPRGSPDIQTVQGCDLAGNRTHSPGQVPIVPLFQQILDEEPGENDGGFVIPSSGEFWLVSALKKGDASLFGGDSSDVEAGVEAAQGTYRFVARPVRPQNPPADVGDYGEEPWSRDSVKYEDPTYSNFRWADFVLRFTGSWDSVPYGKASGATQPFYVDMSFGTLDSVPASDVFVDSPTEFQVERITTDDGVAETADGFGPPHTISFPSGTGPEVIWTFTPKMYLDGVWDTGAGPEFANSDPDQFSGYEWHSSISWPGYNPDWPGYEYDFDIGRWRYWLPDTIGPAGFTWRTVAGPWATPTGVELLILTPMPDGLSQWIPVRAVP